MSLWCNFLRQVAIFREAFLLIYIYSVKMKHVDALNERAVLYTAGKERKRECYRLREAVPGLQIILKEGA